MRKFIIFLCACIVGFFNVNPIVTVYANSKTSKLEQELETSISDQLSDLNFSNLDSYLNDINKDYNFIESTNFKDLVQKISQGDYFFFY